MSDTCPNCGAARPQLPIWTFLVPVGIGAASIALIVAFKGRISGKILAGIVTVAFVGFAAWLATRLRAVLSAACPKCGTRAS